MRRSDLDFDGRTAIVTGATRGIGKSIADLLAALGCHVVCTGTKETEPALRPNQEYFQLDLTDKGSIQRFLAWVDRFESVNILVNNAGINRVSSIEQIKEQDWENVLGVNLTEAMTLIKYIARVMVKRGKGGRILNVSSIFGLVSRVKRSAYSASKAGLIGLTKASALDLAPHNILVNALCPGFTKTELTHSILTSEEIELLCGKIPLGRFAHVDEIARAAVFLCSDFNTYMTGQTLVVDGGYVTQ